MLLAGGSSGTSRLLDGPLRAMPGGYLGDSTGYRRILMGSDFPYFMLWEVDNAEARRGKQALLRHGYQGSRDYILIVDGSNTPHPPGHYWFGRSVTKQHFRRNAVEALQYSGSLGLRTVLSLAHRPTMQEDLDWCEEWTTIIKAGDCQKYLAWVEVLGNEIDVNRSDLAGDINAGMEWAGRLQAIVRKNLPGLILTNGSFGNESDTQDPRYPHSPTLTNSARGADSMDIHNWRGVDFVKHSHTMWLSTHYYGSLRIPIVEGETGGENVPYPTFQLGGDVSTPCNDEQLLFAEIAMQLFTGQAVIYLNGPGVRRKYPLDSTLYFPKLAKACDILPEDIATWHDDGNPSFFNKGKDFFYVGLAAYGPDGHKQAEHPPRPVATWEFYGMNGLVGKGVGQPVIPNGWIGGVLKGRYA